MENQTRYDLNAAVENWRNELAAQPNLASDDRRELETHLRDLISESRRQGLNDEESFRLARERTGQLRLIGKEFKKVSPAYWNKFMAFLAWTMFVVSLFLPVYNGIPGYVCAIWILPLPENFGWIAHGRTELITMEILNYTMLLMIASPVLLFWFGTNAKFMKWFSRMAFVAVILVGWFILYEFVLYYGKVGIMPFDLGCYVWASSFVLLYLSTLSQSIPAQNRGTQKLA
jgi:hypothetical protein